MNKVIKMMVAALALCPLLAFAGKIYIAADPTYKVDFHYQVCASYDNWSTTKCGNPIAGTKKYGAYFTVLNENVFSDALDNSTYLVVTDATVSHSLDGTNVLFTTPFNNLDYKIYLGDLDIWNTMKFEILDDENGVKNLFWTKMEGPK